MKSWKDTEPSRTLHFIVEIDDHIIKTANYSSEEPGLSQNCCKEEWKYSLLSTSQEDRDNIAANTSLANLEYRITQFCFSLQSKWYERKRLQQELHEWSGICKKCLLNLLTIFVICQGESWLYYIKPYKWCFQIPYSYPKAWILCSFVACSISYPRVPDWALLNCFFIISYSVCKTLWKSSDNRNHRRNTHQRPESADILSISYKTKICNDTAQEKSFYGGFVFTAFQQYPWGHSETGCKIR